MTTHTFVPTFFSKSAMLICSIFLLPLTLFSQMNRIQEEIYTVNDGLANRYITCLALDDRGLIWIGTEGGLNVFNGYDFVLFNAQQPSDYQLSATFIHSIQRGADQRLIITYRDNLSNIDLIDPISYAIESIQLNPDFGIKGQPISIRPNSAGELYVLSTYNDESLVLQQWKNDQHRFAIIKEIPIPSSLQRLPVNFYVS
ncbi:MAG: two-component regulator propeller domain-containing protein, partial [Saprospiraceae bacterium]